MDKVYKIINFDYSIRDIESAIRHLKTYNELVCACFNGKMLFSDIDDVNSAYIKITGKSKSEYDKLLLDNNRRYEENKKKHIKNIPKLIKKWTKKGKKILDKKYHELWIEIVPIRLTDLYEGMELKACLDIVSKLNKGCSLDKAKEIIEDQGHSGTSFGLVCSMIEAFCDRGKEFVNYVKFTYE